MGTRKELMMVYPQWRSHNTTSPKTNSGGQNDGVSYDMLFVSQEQQIKSKNIRNGSSARLDGTPLALTNHQPRVPSFSAVPVLKLFVHHLPVAQHLLFGLWVFVLTLDSGCMLLRRSFWCWQITIVHPKMAMGPASWPCSSGPHEENEKPA